jgi:hypothetical protein
VTVRICESLVKRGLLIETSPGRFGLTEAGLTVDLREETK